MIRRHPSAFDLGAWFDGEGVDSVGWHVASCERCRRKVAEFERVRAAVRGESLPTVYGPRRPVVRTAMVAVAAAVVGLAALGPTVLAGPFSAIPSLFSQEPTKEAAEGAGSSSTQRATIERPKSQTGVRPAPRPQSIVPPTISPQPGRTNAAPTRSVPSIRFGVVVPQEGPLAEEGQAVLDAVRKVISDTDDAGGVAGHKIKVVAVPAEDQKALSNLHVQVLVGGFGIDTAPAGTGWLVPSDTGVQGPSVVFGELSAREAGVRLAEDLVARHVKGTVGVIVGDGPDAELANGIASVRKIQKIKGDAGTTCSQEVLSLHLAGVSTLAVAGGPDLQGQCAAAATEQAWWPTGGILLPPSSAYAHLERLPWAQGARTVLGFPWPTDPGAAGAAWFRHEVPGSTSYRALVSFAATELAMQMIRRDGSASATDMRNATLSAPVYRFENGVNEGAQVVVAFQNGWFPAGEKNAGEGQQPSDAPSPPPLGG